MNAPGKGILKVVSILFIVFGAIATVVSLFFTLVPLLVDPTGLVMAAYAAMGLAMGSVVAALIIGIIASILELIFGIMGVKKCADPAKGKFFIVSGIILCVLTLISMILLFSVTSLIGFVLPILFIVGGFMNKKAVA
jgi:hypothetical protein